MNENEKRKDNDPTLHGQMINNNKNKKYFINVNKNNHWQGSDDVIASIINHYEKDKTKREQTKSMN